MPPRRNNRNNRNTRRNRDHPPRLPADGIRAKSQRGEFGQSWWARRWIEALKRLGLDNRLARGATYARGGAVLSMQVEPGEVLARVQGSRPKPYQVEIVLTPLKDAEWEAVVDAMSAQAIFTASLLSGQMPQDIETAFEAAGVSLFPKRLHDLTTNCSCPDVANPCKHIAAVYYLLGERFDEDPFLLFELRGRSKEQIIAALRDRRAAATPETEPAPQATPITSLADQIGRFDQPGDLGAIAVQIAAPPRTGFILRRYGPPPELPFPELMELYSRLSPAALERIFGDEPPPEAQ